MESMLGLRLETGKLYIEPCLPAEWDSYKIHYRYFQTMYRITLTQLHKGSIKFKLIVDGAESKDKFIQLVNDSREHIAEVKYYRGKPK
jgi:cyclic beta-1,2-glucan synthetase